MFEALSGSAVGNTGGPQKPSVQGCPKGQIVRIDLLARGGQKPTFYPRTSPIIPKRGN